MPNDPFQLLCLTFTKANQHWSRMCLKVNCWTIFEGTWTETTAFFPFKYFSVTLAAQIQSLSSHSSTSSKSNPVCTLFYVYITSSSHFRTKTCLFIFTGKRGVPSFIITAIYITFLIATSTFYSFRQWKFIFICFTLDVTELYTVRIVQKNYS